MIKESVNFNDNNLEVLMDTGLGTVDHCRVHVDDIFPNKYYEITASYINRVRSLFDRYDAVIFMARKAICFYKALVINGEIEEPDSCKIYSSRILDYNVLSEFRNKKIALVDDVVVKGTSLAYANYILSENDIDADVYIAAWEYKIKQKLCNSDDKVIGLVDRIKQPYVYLSETDIYSYASYITRYIEASMLPYNIDQPVVLLNYEDRSQIDAFWRKHKVTDVTSALQKNYGIENKVIHFGGELLGPVLKDIDVNLKETFVKIRVFHDVKSKQLLVFPIILFPIISYDTIDSIYAYVQTPELDELVRNTNECTSYENKSKVILYILSHSILNKFCIYEASVEKNFKYEWVDSNERILFSKNILCNDVINSPLGRQLSLLVLDDKWECVTPIRRFALQEYLGVTYTLIFAEDQCAKNEKQNSYFLDSNGNTINSRIITHQYLLNALKQYASLKQKVKLSSDDDIDSIGEIDAVDECIVSNIVDILIDRGSLVPTIVHTSERTLVRAYKCGEIAKLSDKEFELFEYMLNQYTCNFWRDGELLRKDEEQCYYIGKREFEHLCVLFFRRAEKDNIFEKANYFNCEESDDYYSIYYTLYGPVISLANRGALYEVQDRNRLSSKLVSYDYLTNAEGEMYKIHQTIKEDLDYKWKEFAQNFVYDMLFLKSCFPSRSKQIDFYNQHKGNNISKDEQLTKAVLSRVRTFEEMITLMSIGDNELQRTLSLIAEIKVVADLRVSSVHKAMAYMKNNMDSIGDGIWKSRCYMKEDLMDNLQDMLSQGRDSRDQRDISKIFQYYVDASPLVDRNSQIVEFLRNCGKFFYKAYYIVWAIKNNCRGMENIDFDSVYKIPQRLSYEQRYKSLRRNIDKSYRECKVSELNKKALVDLKQLQKEATAMLDICDLYLSQNAFWFRRNMRVLIVCANEKNFLDNIQLQVPGYNFMNSIRNKDNQEKRYFRCFPISVVELEKKELNSKNSSKMLQNNLNQLIRNFLDAKDLDFKELSVSVVIYEANKWYEALLSSGYDAKSKFLEKMLNGIFAKEKEWGRICDLEFIVCNSMKTSVALMNSCLFRLVESSEKCTIQDDFEFTRYGVEITARKDADKITINAEGSNLIAQAVDSTIMGIGGINKNGN